MQENGWIKLYFSILNWEWWGDAAMVRAWIFILMSANYKDSRWMGYEIKAGSFATSLKSLSEQLHTTIDKTRTILARLQKTGEITVTSNHHFTLISINNWQKYQENPTQNPKPQVFYSQKVVDGFGNEIPHHFPNKSQTNPKQIPTEEEYTDFKDNIFKNICPKIPETENGASDLFGNPVPEETKTCLSFEDFWKIYDKKVDKSACRSLYDKLPETTREEIKRHVPLYVQSTPDKTYRKDPVRYLRHRCWENEIIENTKQPQINREEEGF